MASLDKLPRELLDLILPYTTSACQRKLLYTCRRLHEIVQPNIYQKIQITLRPEDGPDRNAVIVQLFRTVRTSPLLAGYVHELEIFGSKPLALLTQLPKAQALFCMGRIITSTGTYMYWLSRLMKGDTDAIVAALIFFLGNLRVLRLGFEVWSDSRFLSATFRAIPCLEEIELSGSVMASTPSSEYEREDREDRDDWCFEDRTAILKTANGPLYYDPKQFEHLFLKSRIKKISLVIPEPRNKWFSPHANLPPESRPKLTRLCLQQSELTPSSLGSLLRLTPSLRDLEYDLRINSIEGGHTMQYFHCADMDAALQPVRSSLERLSISVEFFTTDAMDLGWSYHWGIQGTIKSLAGFSCLASLEIPVVLLLGWTPSASSVGSGGVSQLAAVLPYSLRNLTLTTALEYFESNEWTRTALYSCVGDYITTVAAAASSSAPKNLAQIRLHLCSDTGVDPDHELSLFRLRDICVEADISLHISEYCDGQFYTRTW